MEHREPHIETTPPWLDPVPPRSPMTRRRKLLLATVGVLVVAICLTTFALNSALEARLPETASASTDASSASSIADCSEQYPKWVADWVTAEKGPIATAYGSKVTGTSALWQTPDNFPVAAFAWSQITPSCGNVIRLSDGKTIWQYRLDVDSATRSQFNGVSTMLSAMGYLMVSDQVPLDQIGQDDSSSGAVADGGDAPTSLYREFSAPDGHGDLWMTLFTSDLESDSASGELLIGFTNQ